MTNYNDGNWHVHRGGSEPEGLHPLTKVQTYRVDFSEFYLPEGKGSIYSRRTLVGETPWHNPDGNTTIVSFRVVEEYKEPREVWVAFKDGEAVSVSEEFKYIDKYYTDVRKFVEVKE